ncbi:MAG: hypothetical protein QM778_32985 [Myxococcales bacterium]
MVTSTNRSKWASSPASVMISLLGATLILTTVIACLGFAGVREGSTPLSLRDLERSQTTLMSCARDEGPLSGAELLWCADPSSPLCLPALPASGHIELGDTAPLALWSLALPMPERLAWTLPSWQRPAPVDRPRSLDPTRLERPPRA